MSKKDRTVFSVKSHQEFEESVFGFLQVHGRPERCGRARRRLHDGTTDVWSSEPERAKEKTVCKSRLNAADACMITGVGAEAAYISFSFWGLMVWSIRGLVSTGSLIVRLSLSECSELIDWLRNCETEGGKWISPSCFTGLF